MRIWWCSFYEGGERCWRSTRCADKKGAKQVARQFEREAADPDYASAAKATLTDAFRLLLKDREAKARATPPKASLRTVEFYRTKAGTWRGILEGEEGELGPFLLAQLAAKHVDAFIRQRRLEAVSEHTIHKELTTLRAALKLALRAGIWRGEVAAIIPPGFETGYSRGRGFCRRRTWRRCSRS